jgi:uncharacterized membrane protein YqjE
LRALLDTVLSILHNRSELFTTEMEEEVSRLVRVLVWAIAAVFAVVIGATFLGAMVLLAAPPAYRVWTAAGLGALFLAFAALGLRAIRRIAREKPRPFDASVGELQKDLNHLRSAR